MNTSSTQDDLLKNSASSLEKKSKTGHIHPINQVIQEIYRIFSNMGFEIARGPEIDTEYFNFDALNIPEYHSARDMQDTFWLKDKNEKGERQLPRTHTSTVQIRYMQAHNNPPRPMRIIAPGKVFRNEATDATHEAEFHQLEGMMIDKKVSMADLKGTLQNFIKEFYGEELETRFVPAYFPFVEPGVEVYVKWKNKWLEILGAGLMHPEVLKAGGLNPEEWEGFAFGMGIERLVMLKYGIDDIRHMYSGDLRFVNQF